MIKEMKVTNQALAQTATPGILNILKCKCPRCRRGEMFIVKNPYNLKKTMRMSESCPVCGQPFDIEVGFYYGSSYISYALSIGISFASLLGYWLLIGISTNDNRFFYWLIFNAILLISLQPVIMRIARAVWLAIFVRYDKHWKTRPPERPERVNEAQQNNW